jgi:hypothetical protein
MPVGSVGAMTRNRLDDQKIQVRVSTEEQGFLCFNASTRALGQTHSPVQCVLGGAANSLPTITEVNNAWSLHLHSLLLIHKMVVGQTLPSSSSSFSFSSSSSAAAAADTTTLCRFLPSAPVHTRFFCL